MPEIALFDTIIVMNIVSKSPLRYFQRRGYGRHGAVDYESIDRTDPFRNGQVLFHPRLGTKLNTIERMISKPCATKARLRNFY